MTNDVTTPPDLDRGELNTRIRHGIAWSGAANLVLRVGSLVVGICLARLLSPEHFGVYGVALIVQTVLMSLADMGLSADLIRSDEPEKKAPTVATIAIVSGLTLTATMIISAPYIAALLREPESTRAIQVLSVTLFLAAVGVVPYAVLNRAFAQKKLFVSMSIDFVVGTTVTLGLVILGYGVIGLAVGRVAGHLAGLLALFRLAHVRPTFGFDPQHIGPALRFGIPVALANLLSWALLNVDTVVIARGLGAVQLGFYVLAFNISTWPMTALGAVVRSVALPGFSRIEAGTDEVRDPALGRSFALVWALSLPAGAILAVLAVPLVAVVYGEKWAPAAAVLAALGIFGALRVVFDLFSGYLMARGAARSTLAVQSLWLLALIPAVIIGVRLDGLRGAGWAHVVIAVLVIFPAYLIALRRVRADLRELFTSIVPPLLAMVPAAGAAWLVIETIDSHVVQLLLGGVAAGAVYAALIGRWVRARMPERSHRDQDPDQDGSDQTTASSPTTDVHTSATPIVPVSRAAVST